MMAQETWGLQEHLTLVFPGPCASTQGGKWAWGVPLVIPWVTSLSLDLSFSYCPMETHWTWWFPRSFQLQFLWFCNFRTDVETQVPVGSGMSPKWVKQARWGRGWAGEHPPPLTGQRLLSSCWLLPSGNAGLPDFLIFQEDLDIEIILVCAISWFFKCWRQIHIFSNTLGARHKCLQAKFGEWPPVRNFLFGYYFLSFLPSFTKYLFDAC